MTGQMTMTSKAKTTQSGNSELINLRVPHRHLQRLNAYAKQHGISRSWLLLSSALRIIEEATTEGQKMPPTK